MKSPLVTVESIPALEPYLQLHRQKATDWQAQFRFAVMLLERETYYTALYTPYSPCGPELPAEHRRYWEPHPVTVQAKRILRELHEWSDGPSPAVAPNDLFGLKQEALEGVEAATQRRKNFLAGRLLAAYLCLDLVEFARAFEHAKQALQISPDSAAAIALAFESSAMMPVSGTQEMASARAAERVARKRFGTSWMNGLRRAREDYVFSLRRAAWRLRAQTEGVRFTRLMKSEQQYCEEERERAVSELRTRAVPARLRKLLPLAKRFGVGDDACRGVFLRKATKQERREAVAVANPLRDEIDQWVDSFPPAELPAEAAAYFWLREALEEMISMEEQATRKASAR